MVNLSSIRNDFNQAQSRLQNAATRGKQMLQHPFSYRAPPPPYYQYPQPHFVPPPPQFYAPPPPPPAFYNRPGKPPAPRRYTPAFGARPPPLWYVKSKVPVPAWYQPRASFGAKKLVHAPRSSGTHSTFKKARTTTVNGTKRFLYKKKLKYVVTNLDA